MRALYAGQHLNDRVSAALAGRYTIERELGRLLEARGYFALGTHCQPGCEWLTGDARYRALLDEYGYGWVLNPQSSYSPAPYARM